MVLKFFYCQPPAGEIWRISRLIASYEDTSGMQAQEYGNLGGALTNGIVIRKQDDSGSVINFTNGHPIKTNAAWSSFCYDSDVKTWGAGNELFTARWSFFKAEQQVRLIGDNNERLEVVLNDNFSGLIHQFFHVQGFKETENQ